MKERSVLDIQRWCRRAHRTAHLPDAKPQHIAHWNDVNTLLGEIDRLHAIPVNMHGELAGIDGVAVERMRITLTEVARRMQNPNHASDEG